MIACWLSRCSIKISGRLPDSDKEKSNWVKEFALAGSVSAWLNVSNCSDEALMNVVWLIKQTLDGKLLGFLVGPELWAESWERIRFRNSSRRNVKTSGGVLLEITEAPMHCPLVPPLPKSLTICLYQFLSSFYSSTSSVPFIFLFPSLCYRLMWTWS